MAVNYIQLKNGTTNVTPYPNDYNALVDEFVVYGWSNIFIGRSNDTSFFIYVPQSVLKKSSTNPATYSLSGLFNFNYYCVQPSGTMAQVTQYTLKGVTMMPSGTIQIETTIPSGVGSWTYGLVFTLTNFIIRNHS